jgi:hypothetical protein
LQPAAERERGDEPEHEGDQERVVQLRALRIPQRREEEPDGERAEDGRSRNPGRTRQRGPAAGERRTPARGGEEVGAEAQRAGEAQRDGLDSASAGDRDVRDSPGCVLVS